MNRIEAIYHLADMIVRIQLDHPVRIGIDGVDVSGKTMLADELIEPLQDKGRSVIRVSIDDFHNPSNIRYRQGRDSPQGYYEDSFNHDAIVSSVLEPLGPGGNLEYRSASFDFRSNSEVHATLQNANSDSILLFEGIFLHRPELRRYWDFSIFIHTGFNITIERALRRDLYLFKTAEKVREKYEQRYIPGEQIYLNAELPFQKANVIWNNNEIDNPKLTINKSAKRMQTSCTDDA